jgi:hypothetical protein
MTFDEWLFQAVSAYAESPPNGYGHHRQRFGQFLFNKLYEDRPDLSESVRASPLDPFNHDDRIPSFLYFAKDNWHRQ